MRFICVNNENGNSRFFSVGKTYEGNEIGEWGNKKYNPEDYIQVYNSDLLGKLIVNKSDFISLGEWRYKRLTSILDEQ